VTSSYPHFLLRASVNSVLTIEVVLLDQTDAHGSLLLYLCLGMLEDGVKEFRVTMGVASLFVDLFLLRILYSLFNFGDESSTDDDAFIFLDRIRMSTLIILSTRISRHCLVLNVLARRVL